MVNRRRKSKFLLVGSALMASASTFGTQSVSAVDTKLFSPFYWFVTFIGVLKSGVTNLKGFFEKYVEFKNKWEFDHGSKEISMNIEAPYDYNFNVSVKIVDGGKYKASVESIYRENLKFEFVVNSEEDVESVKKCLETRFENIRKVIDTAKDRNISLDHVLEGMLKLILEDRKDFKFEWQSDDNKKYVVSEVVYDIRDSSIRLYSNDFESPFAPFYVTKDQKIISNLLDKLSEEKKKFDADVLKKAKSDVSKVLGDLNWSFKNGNSYCATLETEGFRVPLKLVLVDEIGNHGKLGEFKYYGWAVYAYGQKLFECNTFDEKARKEFESAKSNFLDFLRLSKFLKENCYFNIKSEPSFLELSKGDDSIELKNEWTKNWERFCHCNNEENFVIGNIRYGVENSSVVVNGKGGARSFSFNLFFESERSKFYDFFEKLKLSAKNNKEIVQDKSNSKFGTFES